MQPSQPSTLLDNLNSDFIAALSRLQPRNAAERVLVYVESDDDISFWQAIFYQFQQKNITFDIQLPSQNALEKGKIAVLKFANRVGKNLILCVDSDYDYLLQSRTETSTLINSNPFIFQTYAYSIENLMCYASSLDLVCIQASKNSNKLFDFDELLKLYSKIIYKLFLWSIHFAFQQDTISYTLSDFCDTIKILEKAQVTDNFEIALNGLSARVATKIAELERNFAGDKINVENLVQVLSDFGINEHNVYLFAQGHTIKDNVVLMFLKPIVETLKNQKIQQIKTNALHTNQISNELDAYKKQLVDIEKVLSCNTEFKSCFLYQKIHADLENYIQNF